jgi:hypothetical protein
MSPNSKSPPRGPARRTASEAAPSRRSSDDGHRIVYFKRHKLDDPTEAIPGKVFVDSCASGVRAKFRARLAAVAAAPPKRFAGGGYWEAMKDEMHGWFEVRADGPNRYHYRLFCLLDYDAANVDLEEPLLTVITGLAKPFMTQLSTKQYAAVKLLGDEYLARNPRSIA